MVFTTSKIVLINVAVPNESRIYVMYGIGYG
jgi:hypothetical protein